ncbi:GyrI-like domain-containing protein [Saccharicrinis sp. FJH2]|uniref:SRPBCC family protein n=1 Tax=Saccharicrinis sp. FJH65 TaxID=3344659 RepID=UPI0035F4A20A
MIKKILLILAIIIAGVVIWLAVIDGSYHVKRTVKVDVPVSKAYTFIADYKNWKDWSPWLIMEKDAEMNYTGEPGTLNHGYSWKGKLTGSGEMTTTKLIPNELIEEGLYFKEPFPSNSDVYWTFKGDSTEAEITWGMKGKMPFLFKFMAKQMEPMIGMDYERGLSMLKEKLETGKVSSEVNVLGVENVDQQNYIGIEGELEFEALDTFMNNAYIRLADVINQHPKLEVAGHPLSIYNDFGMDGGLVNIIAAIPVQGEITEMDGIVSGMLPAGKALKVQHLGKYENTGNAWSAAFSYIRYNKMKADNSKQAFEIYTTDPMMEPDQDKWETIVYVPLK